MGVVWEFRRAFFGARKYREDPPEKPDEGLAVLVRALDGKLPLQPWARELVEQRREDLGKDGMQVRCLPLGPAYATSGDSTGSEMTRIVQTVSSPRK